MVRNSLWAVRALPKRPSEKRLLSRQAESIETAPLEAADETEAVCASMVKSQYGMARCGCTVCMDSSNSEMSAAWLVRKPRPFETLLHCSSAESVA